MRTRRLAIILTIVATFACIVCLAGCGSNEVPSTTLAPSTTQDSSATETTSSSDGTLPAGWSLFESQHVSLALPDTFVGGDPTLLGDYLDTVQTDDSYLEFPVDMESPDFMAISKPGSYATIASVMALFELDPEVADYGMQEWVDAAVSDAEFTLEDAETLSEDVGEDRADVVVAGYYQKNPDPSSGDSPERVRSLHRFVILTGDSWYCRVEYIYEGEEDQALDDIFATSAGTVSVKAD